MKFLLRSLLVLIVAVVFGIGLYYTVKVLPSDSPNPSPQEIQRPTESGNSASVTPTPKPARPEKDRGGIRWRSILGLGRRVVMFTVMVFIAVIAKNFVFERKPDRKKPSG